MYSKGTVKSVKDKATFSDILTGLKKSGKNYYCECPACNESGKGKGLIISPEKNTAHCYSCNIHFSNPLDYLVKQDGMQFVDAVKKLADCCGMVIETEEERKQRLSVSNKRKNKKNFRDLQLESSGLTVDDIEASIVSDDKDTTLHHPVFRVGTLSQYGQIVYGDESGDDMLIEYYNLEGKPVMYQDKLRGKLKHLIRVRWQNPDVHLDKFGKPIKYQSPAGSGTHLYIPEKVRKLYKNYRPIETLYIQEGEKKAEKCCKHDIISVGIMGIQNFGKDGQLPPELQMIISRCEVKRVVFMLDSDYNSLSTKLQNGDSVDTRPRSFFYAVKNYKDYMRTLINLNISVEIYFGYVKPNEKNDKGIDDLMANTLNGRESELKEDINHAVNEKSGEGDWIQLHKITMMNDAQLADLWQLNNAEEFAKIHKNELEHLTEFKIGRQLRRFDDDGKLVLAQPLSSGEQFWEEIENKHGKELQFDYHNCFMFLRNRGFGRVRMVSNKWDFCSIDGRVVSKVDTYDIKDYVTDFTKELKRKDVLNMLYRGGPQYLGPEKLSNLEFFTPNFEKAGSTSQCLYFKDKYWEITAEGIKEYPITQLKSYVWKEKVIDVNISLIEKPFVEVELIDDLDIKHYDLKFSEDAIKSDFFRFLINTSDFYWRKKLKDEPLDPENIYENYKHLLNKLTAIGYLLHDYKNASELKAVIATDGKISEVGTSNGRTGKSLIGKGLEFVIPQVYISAKHKDMTSDQFIFGEVTEKTKSLFVDDVRANFDFEFFFPIITGKMKVNPKGGAPFTLSEENSPKLYITTNHAINGEGSSFFDRQAYIVFSDFYNDERKPIDDFGTNFFSEWNQEQWNLYYNLMANCLQLYFLSIKENWVGRNQGVVPPPMDNVKLRQQRQMMGEDFLTWAEAYFSEEPDAGSFESELNINKRIKRKAMYDEFLVMFPHAGRFVNSTGFGKRIKLYCKYKGFHFNPVKPNDKGYYFNYWQNRHPGESFIGEADKTGGAEYFTIANKDYIHG